MRSKSRADSCSNSPEPRRKKYRPSKAYSYASRSRSRSVCRRPRTHEGAKHYSRDKERDAKSISPPPRRRHLSKKSSSCSLSPRERVRVNREAPPQSRCIGVFGLSVVTTQQQLREIFSKFGPIEKIQVIIDIQTGISRGFCFIYYENLLDAKAAKQSCSGMLLDGRHIRVDYSITQRPHTPTPGIYMGRPTSCHFQRARDYYNRQAREYPSRYEHSTSHHSERKRHTHYSHDHHRHFERTGNRSYTPERRSRR